MPPSNDFPAHFSSAVKIISTLPCLVILAIILAAHNLFLAIPLLFVLFLAAAYSPRGYRIAEGAVVVRRWIGDVRIPLSSVRDARRATAEDVRGLIRLWASGGLFGYYGVYRSSQLGRSTWYVTNRANAVVLSTLSTPLFISPDEPERFLDAIQAAVPLDPARQSAPPSGTTFERRGSFIRVLAPTLLILGLAVGLLALYYAPGPPSYTLTPESLTIHDRFYPVTLQRESVYVSRIRVVNFDDDPGWRPVRRANGFANAHYSSGWFQTANGETVRMYRAGGTRLVLLPSLGNAAPVLMEARNPEQFIEDIKREWATN